MKFSKIPTGTLRLMVTCANMPGLLSTLNEHGIPLFRLEQSDELNATFCVQQSQYQMTVQIIEHLGGKISHSLRAPGSHLVRGIVQRPVLVLGVFLILTLTFYLPTRILFIRVNGNHAIPIRQIQDVAAECGVNFGANRKQIRSEKVKNQLLSKIPELKWVGVNTRGCVAEISVRERASAESDTGRSIVSSVVASRDGIIREMTVTGGKPICRVGQAVRKGQLLVSGYSDCGRCIYGTRAEAEIYALTRRNLQVFTLSETEQRSVSGGSTRKISLIIGKKRINFYKGSGISDATCVRMYHEYTLTLPGGFQLPVTLVVHEQVDYEKIPRSLTPEETETFLTQHVHSYLESQMIAGMVKQGDYQITELNGSHCLIGEYLCDEMIGLTRSEEIADRYEQTN